MPATAEVVINDKTDIDLSVFIPCAASETVEMVDVSGPLHTLVSATVNGNGISGSIHFQPQSISGTGESTGNKYHATDVPRQNFKNSFQNGHAGLTFVNNFRIIGQGPGNNYLVHENLHIVFNANGTVTVFHDNCSTDCK